MSCCQSQERRDNLGIVADWGVLSTDQDLASWDQDLGEEGDTHMGVVCGIGRRSGAGSGKTCGLAD